MRPESADDARRRPPLKRTPRACIPTLESSSSAVWKRRARFSELQIFGIHWREARLAIHSRHPLRLLASRVPTVSPRATPRTLSRVPARGARSFPRVPPRTPRTRTPSTSSPSPPASSDSTTRPPASRETRGSRRSSAQDPTDAETTRVGTTSTVSGWCAATQDAYEAYSLNPKSSASRGTDANTARAHVGIEADASSFDVDASPPPPPPPPSPPSNASRARRIPNARVGRLVAFPSRIRWRSRPPPPSRRSSRPSLRRPFARRLQCGVPRLGERVEHLLTYSRRIVIWWVT